jgi:hypothetical protein
MSNQALTVHERSLSVSVPVQEVSSRCEEWTCDRLREGLDSFTELPNHQCDNRFTTATTYTTEKKGKKYF